MIVVRAGRGFTRLAPTPRQTVPCWMARPLLHGAAPMRIALASVPFLALAACQTAGDRSGTGMCPQGEVCSPKTPKGLDFRGPDYADDWIADATIKPTAVGGTQTIQILDAEDQQPLTFAYTATLDSPSLTAEAPAGAQLT